MGSKRACQGQVHHLFAPHRSNFLEGQPRPLRSRRAPFPVPETPAASRPMRGIARPRMRGAQSASLMQGMGIARAPAMAIAPDGQAGARSLHGIARWRRMSAHASRQASPMQVLHVGDCGQMRPGACSARGGAIAAKRPRAGQARPMRLTPDRDRDRARLRSTRRVSIARMPAAQTRLLKKSSLRRGHGTARADMVDTHRMRHPRATGCARDPTMPMASGHAKGCRHFRRHSVPVIARRRGADLPQTDSSRNCCLTCFSALMMLACVLALSRLTGTATAMAATGRSAALTRAMATEPTPSSLSSWLVA